MSDKVENLYFGDAVGLLQDGYVLTNDEWNGIGMELTLEQIGIWREDSSLIEHYDYDFILKAPNGKRVCGWRPSKQDIFSKKWRVVRYPD